MNDVAFLLQIQQSVDEYGDPVQTEKEIMVFCREQSIGQKEFYQAHANGFQPEIKLILADYLDYAGEQQLYYTPRGCNRRQRYRILRTYRTGQELELVCYREVNPA